ncbi:bifunctional proline dehydrogenase/L-glutamate gamma-semialdehyde dehydrogenase PutA [Breoghania sp. L-A4]|uniref:bifunctional proline dehydrogenase/L-glutamate gamma-semialdehyde dehydrogenase PutA n=1 Tax=Breoghania sp. L-A4 TaxID=2304600 RepID=UPI0020C0303F|nr:bifunctional proline dehydrogenase/L-glutamate gamma-semialdehyde dehydrogenase PutA [Breoghania sp. L-A4]
MVRQLLADTRLNESAQARIAETAGRYIEAIRNTRSGLGGVEDFLREYGLSTREGLALMVLAEALLRVPDAATTDKLIEDKLAAAQFSDHQAKSDTWLVSASSWALGITARLLHPGDTPETIMASLVKRMGMPALRTATRQAMKILGHQFVLGQTISSALDRAKGQESKGYSYSYDMLGEGARTAEDAERYFASYADAIKAIGRKAKGKELHQRPGISVKLSALHPRFEAVKGEGLVRELAPRLAELAALAKAKDLNFTVDAEEADRLEISLDVLAATLRDPALADWDGFGLAVQAYQKRSGAVIDWVRDLAASGNRRISLRLVKGAYWDTEIKRAQERGLADFPVFTRKAATDLNYAACAKRLFAAGRHIFPQFATHNAVTVAQVLELSAGSKEFEFQRLHGMGESLYRAVTEKDGHPCRIYAPVGGHRDLLAYLVRRLLENGANSSFVAVVGDPAYPVSKLLEHPDMALDGGDHARHSAVPLPGALYGARRNSEGLEFGYQAERDALLSGMAKNDGPSPQAVPLIGGKPGRGVAHPVRSPVDGTTVAGTVTEAREDEVETAFNIAGQGFRDWSRRPVGDRAQALERAGDLIEEHRDRLMALLALEAGKTLPDGLAEIREAVDFCRYYAAEARGLFGAGTLMPGPTGEENRFRYRGRGTFICISPWNFPLAIFTGQVVAALVAGNAVIAKPAEQTPLIAFEMVKLLHEAGVPVNALQLLPGDGRIGAALVNDPRVAGVAFTGSTQTAWAINRALAAKDGAIVPLIAETGGINAMVVDATALPEQVTDDVVMSAFRSAGQRCSALRLLFVQDEVADKMIEMIAGAARMLTLGDPRDPATDIGPVIDAEAKARLEAHIATMGKTQKVVYAGATPQGTLSGGTWVAPHVIELDRAEALEEEVFGPVLHVVRYQPAKLGAVLETIASTGFGLTLGVHSRIDTTVQQVVDRLPVGNVYVNRNTIGAVVGTQPFGGSGLSGTGPKAGGPGYLPRFALEQVVSINTAAAGGNASLLALSEE